MEVIVLASGSSGNSIYVEEGDTNILVDAGLSGKAIKERLQKAGKRADSIQGILVTHEHQDHIKGVGVLSRKYQIPVYATRDTWKGMQKSVLPVCTAGEQNLPKQGFHFGEIFVEPFPLSHDALDPVGFCLHGHSRKLGIATDSGFFTPPMMTKLQNCDGLILESNHDLELLAESNYPEFLKQRIRSRKGHISNNVLLDHLPELINKNLRWIILAHLSEENNCPHKLRQDVSSALERILEGKGTTLPFNIVDKSSSPVALEL